MACASPLNTRIFASDFKFGEFHAILRGVFVKIIHRQKHSQKNAFWKRGTAVLTSCLSGSFEIDIESKWVYSHIKLSFSISYMMIKVRTQFDMVVNPL